MTSTAKPAFEKVLARFPEAVRPRLSRLPHQRGVLDAVDVAALCRALNAKPQTLALALLPLAQSFARPEISGFSVGAVAVAKVAGAKETEGIVLHMGANLEFKGLPLYHTIHAEQAAVLNAWQAGTNHIQALAVSAPPCGACRQFLMEAAGTHDLEIFIPSEGEDNGSTRLATLLPNAFGPGDLSRDTSLFEPGPMGVKGDQAVPSPAGYTSDDMIQIAMTAAMAAYAPYTNHLAGCALRLADGQVVVGRGLESAAYNPGVTAVQASLALASLTGVHLPDDIERVVLAERPTIAGQAAATELLLSTWAPGAEFITHLF